MTVGVRALAGLALVAIVIAVIGGFEFSFRWMRPDCSWLPAVAAFSSWTDRWRRASNLSDRVWGLLAYPAVPPQDFYLKLMPLQWAGHQSSFKG